MERDGERRAESWQTIGESLFPTRDTIFYFLHRKLNALAAAMLLQATTAGQNCQIGQDIEGQERGPVQAPRPEQRELVPHTWVA